MADEAEEKKRFYEEMESTLRRLDFLAEDKQLLARWAEKEIKLYKAVQDLEKEKAPESKKTFAELVSDLGGGISWQNFVNWLWGKLNRILRAILNK